MEKKEPKGEAPPFVIRELDLQTLPRDAQVSVTGGRYSGKSQVASSLALHWSSENVFLMAPHLSAIEPYFKVFGAKGIQVVSSGEQIAQRAKLPGCVVLEETNANLSWYLNGDGSRRATIRVQSYLTQTPPWVRRTADLVFLGANTEKQNEWARRDGLSGMDAGRWKTMMQAVSQDYRFLVVKLWPEVTYCWYRANLNTEPNNTSVSSNSQTYRRFSVQPCPRLWPTEILMCLASLLRMRDAMRLFCVSRATYNDRGVYLSRVRTYEHREHHPGNIVVVTTRLTPRFDPL